MQMICDILYCLESEILMSISYMMLMATSIAPLHFLCQDDQTEVQHDFFSHVTMALAPASHDVHGIINGTTEFHRSK